MMTSQKNNGDLVQLHMRKNLCKGINLNIQGQKQKLLLEVHIKSTKMRPEIKHTNNKSKNNDIQEQALN